jgi:hypothetical protein
MLNDAFHGAKHPGKGLFKIVGDYEDFIRCFLGEGPPEGQRAVQGSLAALLHTRIDDGVPWQPTLIVRT